MGLHVVVTFENGNTGASEDRVVNTFTVATSGIGHTADNYSTLANSIHAFYGGDVDPAVPYSRVAQYLSPVLSRADGDMTISLYELQGHLDGSPHGSPVAVFPSQLATTSVQSALPSEVALAVTLEANGRADQLVETQDGPDEGIKVDRPRQRYTGRIYLGPLSADASTSNVYPIRPSAPFLDVARKATVRLCEQIRAMPGLDWDLGVWSRADAAIRGVSHVSTDNAFDTQRRRGERPTERVRVAVNQAI